jgi:hypothetical protein
MTDWNASHVEIVARMVRVPVTGSHHKQSDTIKQWADLEGDVFEDALDDLVTDPTAPVHQKGRGTVTLTSVPEAKEFIEEHDDDDEYTWFL